MAEQEEPQDALKELRVDEVADKLGVVSVPTKELTIGMGELDPWERIRFALARWALLVITGLAVLSGVAYHFAGANECEAARDIWDFAKATLPPLVTLILGYYFASERRKET